MGKPETVSLEKAQAALPNSLRGIKSGISARVVVRLFVAETGTVEGAKIDESSGYPRVDEAALKAISGQKMNPATTAGQPIAACVTLPIVWKLK
jgi:protein TonB